MTQLAFSNPTSKFFVPNLLTSYYSLTFTFPIKNSIALAMVRATMNGQYTCYWGLEGFMLSTLTAGMGPVTNLLDLICQVCLMGIFRLVSLFYLFSFRNIIDVESKKKKEIEKKSD